MIKNGFSTFHKVYAFTLAEVLITLGIIGVIAAMTLPTLIQKHQQLVTLNQLKRSYAMFSTAVERAKADYGDMGDWGYLGDYSKVESPLAARELPYAFFKKYLKPYMPVIVDSYTTIGEMGYSEPIKHRNGSNNLGLSTKVHYIGFNDGSTMVCINSQSVDKDEDGKSWILSYIFQVDINGIKGPNILGKDVFAFELPLANNAKLDFRSMNYAIYMDTKKVVYYPVQRENLLKECTTVTGNLCGALIQTDGWQIKKDYGW